MNLEIICVPIITTCVYWIINLLKYTLNNNPKFKRFIPLTAMILGVIFGVIFFYGVPDIIPTDNLVVALIIGGASGLSATGANQIIKQLNTTITNSNHTDNCSHT